MIAGCSSLSSPSSDSTLTDVVRPCWNLFLFRAVIAVCNGDVRDVGNYIALHCYLKMYALSK